MIHLILLIFSFQTMEERIPYCANLAQVRQQSIEFQWNRYKVEPLYFKLCDDKATQEYITRIKKGTY